VLNAATAAKTKTLMWFKIKPHERIIMNRMYKWIDPKQVKLGITVAVFLVALGFLGKYMTIELTDLINNTANQYNTNYVSLTK
jgi:hypothetical protein